MSNTSLTRNYGFNENLTNVNVWKKENRKILRVYNNIIIEYDVLKFDYFIIYIYFKYP